MFGNSPGTGRRPIDPTVSLFVSLYVILLSFFIVMNVISNQATARAVAVLESVERAFERPFPPRATTPGLTPPAPHRAVDSAFLVDAGTLISAFAGSAPEFPDEGGRLLSISLDAHRLFFENSARLSEQAGQFLASLAALLAAAAPDERREALFYFGTSGSEGALALQRAGSLARALQTAGAPAGSMAVGLIPDGRGRQVEVQFRSAPRALARITLAPAPGEAAP